MKDTQLAQVLEKIGKSISHFDGRKCPPVRCGDCDREHLYKERRANLRLAFDLPLPLCQTAIYSALQ